MISRPAATGRRLRVGRRAAGATPDPFRSSSHRSAPVSRRLAVLLPVAVLLASCGGGQPSSVTWRNITFSVPDGWYVFEQEETRLSLSNADLGIGEPGEAREQPEGDVVAMHFTYEPRTRPDDVRDHLERQNATIESDRQLLLGEDEVPATQIVYAYETGGTPTREMVVVIASRAVVLLAIPVPLPGDTDAPDVFLRHLETFLEVLDSAQFGSPRLD
jgi:hypothetical protein